MKAKLILEDGSVFEGMAFGAKKSVAGEVVFSTGMVGYEQSLTDPSYFGQILTFTYPLIGNWGVPSKLYWESTKIQVAGVVISDLTTIPSHWQSQMSLDKWLRQEDIPAIVNVDTRRLTQKLREKGVMLGKVITNRQDIDFWDPNTENLVEQVSPKEMRIHKPEKRGVAAEEGFPTARSLDLESIINNQTAQRRALTGRKLLTGPRANKNIKIALLNCGAKESIRKNLLARGAIVYELPWNYDPFENKLPIDGLVISNGPGDPKMAKESIAIIKKTLTKKIPIFGICLGNQLLALAAGGNTYKLKFGHRAQNQPTIEIKSGRCFITTQNHGFAVDEKKLPDGFKRWFYNANDNTNEGIIHEKLPFFSVQFHPEATPGPYDTEFLFDYFMEQFR